MPRLHCLRLLAIIPLIYICLTGLWIFLPSPTIRTIFRSAHIQSTLTSGKPVITVHADSTSLKYNTYRTNGECDHLAITYQLQRHPRTDSITLFIDNAEINLTDHVLQNPPSLDPNAIKAKVRAGSTDHIINMPWFHVPDAILFHNTMHGFDADVNLRVLVPEKGVVEVWKDSQTWNRYESSSQLKTEEDVFSRISVADREVGMMIRLKNVPNVKGARAEIRGIIVEDIQGELTSRTYWVRNALMGPLGPIPTVVLFLFYAAVLPILECLISNSPLLVGFYAVVVALFWLVSGRPGLRGWSQQYMLLSPLRWVLGVRGSQRTKKRRHGIWTSTGPFEDSDDELKAGRDHPRSYGKRLDEMMKGVRIRPRSIDLEARRSEGKTSYDEKYG